MAGKVSLSRLRLTPHYTALARYQASEGIARLRLEVEDTAGCDEVAQICRHLDLEFELAPSSVTGSGPRVMMIRRGAEDLPPDDELEEAPVPEPTAPRQTPATAAGPPLKRKVSSRAAAEADYMLRSSPEALGKLEKFYDALMDSFPGFQKRLAKLMVEQLRIAGYTAPSSESSSSLSSSSSSSGKKKKKRSKKKAKKKKKHKKASEKKTNMKAEPDAGEPAVATKEQGDSDEPEGPTLAELVAQMPAMSKDELAAELDAELAGGKPSADAE